jgi:hypothetical protein
MKPDEMRKHIKDIKGLGQFPIRDHDHLTRMLGGKDSEFRFKDRNMTVEDVMRMFPTNYFPIESEEDLAKKAAKLVEIGRAGFHTAAGMRPENQEPPALGYEQKESLKEQGSDGYAKRK